MDSTFYTYILRSIQDNITSKIRDDIGRITTRTLTIPVMRGIPNKINNSYITKRIFRDLIKRDLYHETTFKKI